MIGFTFRRLGQGLLVLGVMSLLVFVGVYAIGNPVELLVNPQADDAERLRATIALGLDNPLGLVAGLKPDSWIGRSIMAGSILGFSLPTFWVGLVLIMVFSVNLGWLPSNGRGETVLLLGVPVSFLTVDGLKHLAMPALNLALFRLALLIRLTRASTREAALQDYVKFARAKGLAPIRVIGVHILKNIVIPIATVIGLELGSVIAGAIVTETIFAWPGSG